MEKGKNIFFSQHKSSNSDSSVFQQAQSSTLQPTFAFKGIQGLLNIFVKAVEEKNFEAIEGLSKSLNDAWAAASEDMAKAQQAQGGQEQAHTEGDASTDAGNSGDAEDVEFEEVK